MRRELARDIRTTAIATVVASMIAAPTVAVAAYVANADRVDQKHAVGAGASVDNRKGKLVATNATTGRLPNNIIAKAPDANRLDGMDSADLALNGYEVVRVQGPFNSTAHKLVDVDCPAGTRVLGGGAQVFPSLLDGARDAAPIVIRWSEPGFNGWSAAADEISPYGFDWWVSATAICGK